MSPLLLAAYGLPKKGLMALVRAYRLLLSPWLGNGCRFEPTCSAYSLQALEQHGGAGWINADALPAGALSAMVRRRA